MELTKMLNSAYFVIFPSMKLPPMIESTFICSATSGNVANSRAALVIVPVTMSPHVLGSVAMIALRIARIAFSGCTCVRGMGRSLVPSIPVLPTHMNIVFSKRIYHYEKEWIGSTERVVPWISGA